MRHPIRCKLLLASLSLGGAATAQWHYFPHDPNFPVAGTNHFVSHETANGIAAVSAYGNGWSLVTPAGAVPVQVQDACLLAFESPGVMRGYSAFHHSTATIAVSSSWSLQSSPGAQTFCVIRDNAPGFGVLRAYSAFTNTWASVALQNAPTFSLIGDANVAVQLDGLNYHAYSPYTGQWVTYTAGTAAGLPVAGMDFVVVDLAGLSGPRQYAAFSSIRASWSLSPTYPTSGAGAVSASGARCFALRTDLGAPTSFRYAGYTPSTGQWTISPMAHAFASSVSAVAFRNLLRVVDSDPTARFEMFGSGNGQWQALTGPDLIEEALRDDCHIVRTATAPNGTVYAASALIGGGYASLTLPTSFPQVSSGSRAFLVTGGALPASNVAYGYSAAYGAFVGPIPQPSGSGVSQGTGGAVAAFNVTGSAAAGTSAMAFSARHGDWIAGPAVVPSQTWQTFASNSLAITVQSTFPGTQLHLFDEHRDQWRAPVIFANTPTWSLGPNCVLLSSTPSTYAAYSAQRGEWVLEVGFGTITSGGGLPFHTENLVWFTDSNNRVCVFTTPCRAQTWWQWPQNGRFAVPGGTAPGTTPDIALSTRGAVTEYGLLFAALDLPPAPMTIPGIVGTLDLAVPGAVYLGDVGFFDVDGVHPVRLPIGGAVPPGTTLWLQLVTVDLVSGLITLHDRATGSTLF